MLTRIVCDQCNSILRNGDIGAPTEHKVCLNCVRGLHPAADPNEIKTLPGTLQANELNRINEIKRFKNINIEMPYKIIKGEWCLVIELSDYYKNKFAEIGLTKDKLYEFIKDINDIEKEQENEKDDKEEKL